MSLRSRPLLVLLCSLLISTISGQWVHNGCLAKKDQQQDLFCPGDLGYHCYRIPSLARSSKTGALLAFVEARKDSCADQGFVDLRMRRSLDGGRTWLPSQLVRGESNATSADRHTIGDACPVYDHVQDTFHLIYTRDNVDVFYTSSSDDGATWAAPRNISGQIGGHRAKGGFIGSGHAGGIQLRQPAGRLLVPLHGPCHGIYSDDHGKTWESGRGLTDGGECQFAELRPGLVVATARPTGNLNWTQMATSADGGATFTPSVSNHDLRSPIGGCDASIVAHPNGKLYHSAPDSWFLRDRMVVKVSEDHGATWGNHFVAWTKAAGYSAMAVLGNATDSDIGLYYGRNDLTEIIFEAQAMSFTRFKP